MNCPYFEAALGVWREVERLRNQLGRDHDDRAAGEWQGLDRLDTVERPVRVEDHFLKRIGRGGAIDDGRLPFWRVLRLEWDDIADRRTESILVGILFPDPFDPNERQHPWSIQSPTSYPHHPARRGVLPR